MLCMAWLLTPTAAAVAADAKLTFEKHIRPIFKTHCFHCHGEEEELEGGLDLRLRRMILKGGDSGAALVPGKGYKELFGDEELPYSFVLNVTLTY